MLGSYLLCWVMPGRWHHSLVPIPCVLNLKHVVDYIQLLGRFLWFNVKNWGACFGNESCWRVCWLVSLINCLENRILMLFVLRNVFFSVFWEQIIDLNVRLAFLCHSWEVLLSIFLRHYVWLQVINNQVSDTFSPLWLWFVRWRPLIFDFPEAHIREVPATYTTSTFKEPLSPLSRTPISIVL